MTVTDVPKPRDRWRTSTISVGDLLEAAVSLSPGDPATRAAIVAVLGLQPARERVREPVPDVRPGSALRHDGIADPSPTKRQVVPSPSRAESAAIPAPKIAGGAAAVTVEGSAALSMPDWAALGSDPFLAASGDVDSIPPPALFRTAAARAILSAMLATWRDGDQLDIDRAIASIATGRPLRRLPMRPAPTLRRGAQVLIDRSDAMLPFQADIDGVLADLERLFAHGHVQRLHFRHCPTRGVRQGPAKRRPWAPPARGVPVLVLSDFGVGTPLEDCDAAHASEWLEFARQVTLAGCGVVGLTPFGPRRWPATLARSMAFVHWSERTSAREAARALRDAERRGTRSDA